MVKEIDSLVRSGEMAPESALMRRNSTGDLSIQIKETEKVLSRYLRASLGSCHDLCKHGMKNDTERKAKNRFPKRYRAAPDKSEDAFKGVNSEHRREKSVIATKPSQQLDSQTPTICKVIQKEVLVSAASSKQVSSAGEELCGFSKCATDLNQKSRQPKESPLSAPRLSRRHSEIIIPKDLEALEMTRCEVIKKEVPASPKKITASSKQVSLTGEGQRGLAKYSSSLNQKHWQTKASVLSAPRRLSRRHSEIIIPKDFQALQIASMGVSSSRRNKEIKISKDVGTSKSSKEESLILAPKPSTKGVLNTKYRKDTHHKKVSNLKTGNSVMKLGTETPSTDIVPKKTSYVIEAEAGSLHITPSFKAEALHTENKRESTRGMKSTKISSLSPNKGKRHTGNRKHNTQSSASSFSLMSSSSTSLSSEPMHARGSGSTTKQVGNKIENHLIDSRLEHRSRPRRVGRVVTEDVDSSPWKLKFRRGKVVDIRPENSSPRRLKFKRRKIVRENQSGNAENIRERSLRRLVDVDVELDDTKTEPVTVVLRHQDVEGRKETQSLFNYVIEETASKFVESRKSKVKALVDAFETVFSLQDTKSSEVSEC